MIFKNYYRYLNTRETLTYTENATTYSSNMIDTAGNTPVLITNGVPSTARWFYIEAFLNNLGLSHHISLQFDSGIDELSSSMYTMPNIINNITNVEIRILYAGEDNMGKMNIIATGKNNNDDDIIIKRIGIIKGMQENTSDSTSVLHDVLLASIDLDRPLQVSSGSFFSLNLEWQEI